MLPPFLYAALLDELPPRERFEGHAPKLSHQVDDDSAECWRRFQSEVVAELLAPALLALLAPWRTAAPKKYKIRGRVMLRTPGYHQGPHVDPARSVLTGILYLARPGDSPTYGTSLFAVERPVARSHDSTYYFDPEQCRAVQLVEFRPNRLLAFVNDVVHGAEFPAEAEQRERYAYQFYVKSRS